MTGKFTRLLRIIGSRAKSLSLKDMASLLVTSLFKKDKIVVYGQALVDETPGSGRPLTAQRIVKGDLAELDSIRRRIENPPWEFFCDLYDGVKDFFIFKDEDGRIGHIIWVYYKGDPNRLVELSDGEAEAKYALTFEPYRGKGLYPEALKCIQEYLRERGYKRLFGCVAEDNLSSIRGVEKAGFKKAGRMTLVKFMGAQLGRRFSYNPGGK